jgi:hypothetical protein
LRLNGNYPANNRPKIGETGSRKTKPTSHPLTISIDDSEVKMRLLEYLARFCNRADMAYAAGPDRILGGRDAAIFGFELSAATARFSGPMILRLARKADPMRVRLEAIVYTTLAAMNYPVPLVAVTEPDATVLGGPFKVMTRLAGRPLADEIDTVGKAQSLMGELRRLLSLPPPGWHARKIDRVS